MDIIYSLKVQDNTKANYVSKYKKCIANNIMYNDPEHEIIRKLKTLDEKPNNILAFLNVVFVIRKKVNMSIDLLKEFRTYLITDISTKPTLTNLNNQTKKLPSIEDLVKYTEGLYARKKWRSYIINYLLLMTNCRNKDLDLLVTTKDHDDKSINYLVVYSNGVRFIRNNYKTAKKYGSKTHDFKNAGLLNACMQFLGSEDEKRLLTENNSGNISNYVASVTYDKLGSGRYNKIAVSSAGLNKLIQIGNSRGTSVNVLLDNYYIDRSY